MRTMGTTMSDLGLKRFGVGIRSIGKQKVLDS